VLYVTDDGNLPGPIFSVTVPAKILMVTFHATSNPSVSTISSGGALVSPTGVVVLPDSSGKEWLYVSDTGNPGTQPGTTLYEGYVIKIDPVTGAQTILSKTGTQYFDLMPHQNTNPIACPVSMAPVYSNGV